jgi:hypothetical protein
MTSSSLSQSSLRIKSPSCAGLRIDNPILFGNVLPPYSTVLYFHMAYYKTVHGSSVYLCSILFLFTLWVNHLLYYPSNFGAFVCIRLLVANYLRASLTVANSYVGGQPEGKSCFLPCRFHLSFPSCCIVAQVLICFASNVTWNFKLILGARICFSYRILMVQFYSM